MKCQKCGGKGYLESFMGVSASFTPSLMQCCDIGAYSREVQRRLNDPKYVTQTPTLQPQPVVRHCAVIQLRKKNPDEKT